LEEEVEEKKQTEDHPPIGERRNITRSIVVIIFFLENEGQDRTNRSSQSDNQRTTSEFELGERGREGDIRT